MLAERTKNMVIFADTAGRIEWVNAAFTKVTGYKLDEVRGRTPGSVLQGPDTDRNTVSMMHAAVQAHRGFAAEVLNYDKRGLPYWTSKASEPVAPPSVIFNGRVVKARFAVTGP